MENFDLMPITNGGQTLTRAQMKHVLGGSDEEPAEDGIGGAGMKCCYTNPTGCSVCDSKATTTNATCPVNMYGSQGVLTAC
jgi:hypothetical protein